MPAGARLSEDQQSVFLKYLLLGEVREIGAWRRRWQRDPLQLGPALYLHLEEALHRCRLQLRQHRWPEALLLDTSPRYAHRLIELAAAAVLSEALAPEVYIAPQPQSAEALGLAGRWCHALCFAAAPLFPHEFYPLAVDALARDAAHQGQPYFGLLGVHLDWLDSHGRIGRALWLDAEGGCLREAELAAPLAPHSAHFLCLGHREQVLHAHWSTRMQCLQVNPAGAAALADDKGWTLEGWQAAGVRVPNWQRCAHGDLEGALQWLRRWGEGVVKPNQATEGEGVVFLAAGDEAGLEHQLEALWARGEVLLQERVDELLFCDPQTGTAHTLALRLNVVAAHGRRWAESGYAQVGAGAHRPAAGSQGGHCRPIDEVLPHLVRRRDGLPVPMDNRAWEAVVVAAEEAAGLFAGLMLVGLDLVLALGESGDPVPVFLEANPRPAGLAHSRFLQGTERGLPGVSLRLWDDLERLASGANCGGKV